MVMAVSLSSFRRLMSISLSTILMMMMMMMTLMMLMLMMMMMTILGAQGGRWLSVIFSGQVEADRETADRVGSGREEVDACKHCGSKARLE
jgi:hypothetical protein